MRTREDILTGRRRCVGQRARSGRRFGAGVGAGLRVEEPNSEKLRGEVLAEAERVQQGQQAAQVQQAAPASKRRQIVIGGRRVKTVDVHTHGFVPEVAALVAGTSLEKAADAGARQLGSAAEASPTRTTIPVGPGRVNKMDRDGSGCAGDQHQSVLVRG